MAGISPLPCVSLFFVLIFQPLDSISISVFGCLPYAPRSYKLLFDVLLKHFYVFLAAMSCLHIHLLLRNLSVQRAATYLLLETSKKSARARKHALVIVVFCTCGTVSVSIVSQDTNLSHHTTRHSHWRHNCILTLKSNFSLHTASCCMGRVFCYCICLWNNERFQVECEVSLYPGFTVTFKPVKFETDMTEKVDQIIMTKCAHSLESRYQC